MSSYLATDVSTNDIESWNHAILTFDLDGLETASADHAGLDQRIGMSLASFFGDHSPVGYDPCDQFHCSAYIP